MVRLMAKTSAGQVALSISRFWSASMKAPFIPAAVAQPEAWSSPGRGAIQLERDLDDRVDVLGGLGEGRLKLLCRGVQGATELGRLPTQLRRDRVGVRRRVAFGQKLAHRSRSSPNRTSRRGVASARCSMGGRSRSGGAAAPRRCVRPGPARPEQRTARAGGFRRSSRRDEVRLRGQPAGPCRTVPPVPGAERRRPTRPAVHAPAGLTVGRDPTRES
jgi:hypothetical protein